MEKFIIFLRGVNVGGHKKIRMADLRMLLEKEGFNNVKTYIQSGNVVVEAKGLEGLSDQISRSIKKQYGFEVPAIAFSAAELAGILDDCPFPEEKKQASYFLLLFAMPDKDLAGPLQEMECPGEELHVSERCVYLYYALGAGKAKLTSNLIEQKLKVVATARNYRTMMKMLELAR